MRKDNKIKKMQKRSIIFSIITGIVSIICVAIVVAAIFACFTGYVFAELYTDNSSDSKEITEMISKHMSASEEKVINYANGISESISNGYAEVNYMELKRIFEIVSNGNGFINLGIKLYESDMQDIGTLADDVKNTDFYKKANDGTYGIGNEIIDENPYLTYTAPVMNGEKEVGVLYATERGEINDLYYNFIDNSSTETKTGIRVCYILNNEGKVVAYCGNGSIGYKCNINNKQNVNYSGAKPANSMINNGKSFEMFIESANSKFGIVGEKFNIDMATGLILKRVPVKY